MIRGEFAEKESKILVYYNNSSYICRKSHLYMKNQQKTRTLLSFDWAVKRLLQNKANYVVLEGFLSELLKRQIKVRQIMESESNHESSRDKSNRVDMLVENEGNELIIIKF
jgi:hypothetical protein